MNSAPFRALAALAAMALPGLATAQVTYTDPVTYQVESRYPAATYPVGYQMDDTYRWDSSYVFSPTRAYTSSEQTYVINNEKAITGAVQITEVGDPEPVLSLDQGSIYEASNQNVPPVQTVEGTGAPSYSGTQPFTRSYYKNEKFGNSVFGAGYVVDLSFTATPPTQTAAKSVQAYADGKVYATAFNTEKEVVRGRVDLAGQQGGTNSGTARLYLMQQQIWSANLYNTFSVTPIDWSRTFFNAQKRFMVGPVPVKVTASLAGSVRLTVSGQVGPTVAKIAATPGASVTATASAAVDIIVAAFGVQGNLTLINVSLPLVAEVFWPFCTVDWKLSATLNLTALSGNIKLFAKVSFIFFKKKWTVTIANWSGITRNITLYSKQGTQDLGVCTTGKVSMSWDGNLNSLAWVRLTCASTGQTVQSTTGVRGEVVTLYCPSSNVTATCSNGGSATRSIDGFDRSVNSVWTSLSYSSTSATNTLYVNPSDTVVYRCAMTD